MLKARTPTRRELLLMILLSCLVMFKLDSDLARVPVPLQSNPRAVSHTLTGNIRLHKNFHSRFLARDRDIIVYLPPGYEQEQTRRYPRALYARRTEHFRCLHVILRRHGATPG